METFVSWKKTSSSKGDGENINPPGSTTTDVGAKKSKSMPLKKGNLQPSPVFSKIVSPANKGALGPASSSGAEELRRRGTSKAFQREGGGSSSRTRGEISFQCPLNSFNERVIV